MNKITILNLKEQNATKYLCITFFLLIMPIAYCQNGLNGKYSNLAENQMNYNYYLFDSNGIFEYHSGSDIGESKYGKGYFFVRNDSLVLDYSLTKLKENSYHRFKKFINSKDSIVINFNLYSLQKNNIKNASILGDNDIKNGVVSDNIGKAYLRFQKENKPKKIKISHICCGSYEFTINGKFNYDIDIFLKNGISQPLAIKNELITYKIIELNNIFFKIRTNGKILKYKRLE